MQMWNGALKFANRTGNFILRAQKSHVPLPHVAALSASYHCSRSLYLPRESHVKPVVRLRRSPFGQSGNLPVDGSTEWRREAAENQDEPEEFSSPRKQRIKPSPAPRERRTEPVSRVPLELQKLQLEDLNEEPHKAHKSVQKRGPFSKPDRKDRQFDFVFGVAPCLLALSQGKRKMVQLFVKHNPGVQRESVQRVCDEALRRHVPIQQVSKKELDNMTSGGVHQGLCLQSSPLGFLREGKSAGPREDDPNPRPLWLVLDRVQDPMNLGSILRSAYYLGVDRVASSIRDSCPPTPVVSKASSGVMEIMRLYGYQNLPDLVKLKVEQGWQAVGTVGMEAENLHVPIVPCSEFTMTKPTLLLMGGEGEGLSAELRQLCSVLLTVPPKGDLHPAVDSLNVSVATGILLHSILSSARGGV